MTNTDLVDLGKRLGRNQLSRFVRSGKTLDEFLASEDEMLIDETLRTLAKVSVEGYKPKRFTAVV